MAKGICTITTSSVLNPAVDKPIPDYAKAWHPAVRRPSNLPEDYDQRIAPECIFFLPADTEDTTDEPTELGVYVVARKCDHCERLRKACTRARPTCQTCLAGRHECTTSNPGYVNLSGPKGTRPSRTKGGESGQSVQQGVVQTKLSGRAQTEDPSNAKLAHPRLRTLRQRASTAARESNSPMGTRNASAVEKSTKGRANGPLHDTGSTSPVSEVKASRKRKAKTSEAQTNSTGPSQPKKDNTTHSTDASTSRKLPTSRKRRRVSATHVSSDTDKELTETAGSGCLWDIVRPPTKPENDAIPAVFENFTLPRIWTSNKEELLEALPALKKEVNGLVWCCVETPVLFVEGPTWPEDRWVGKKAIELTMVRERRTNGLCSGATSFEQPLLVPPATAPDVLGSSSTHLVPTAPLACSSASQPPNGPLPKLTNHDGPSVFSAEPTQNLDQISTPRALPIATHPLESSVIRGSPPCTTQLELLCEASSIVEHVIHDKCQDTLPFNPVLTDGREKDVAMRTTPHSRSSSVNPALTYEQAANVTARTWTLTQTWVYSHRPNEGDAMRGSPSIVTRFETSNVRGEAQDGPAESAGELKQGLLHILSGKPTTPFAQSSTFNGYPSHADHSGDVQSISSTEGPQLDGRRNSTTLKPPWAPAITTKNLPPEFQALQDNHRIGLPVSVIMCNDSNLWPFKLPLEYGCVFLGFFRIARLDLSREQAEKVVCHICLEWVPGGENAEDPAAESNYRPWWMWPEDVNGNHFDMTMYPATLLPLHILAIPEFSDVDRVKGVSEQTSFEGWHCLCCGKLNVQRNLRRQSCSHCGKENGLPPIRVDCVRNPHLMAPSSFPWDKTSGDIVSTSRRHVDGSCTQSYRIAGRATVKHIYTCNNPEVQAQPTCLFVAIQKDVELLQSKASTWLTGTHYIHVMGDGPPKDGTYASPSDTPSCLLEAQNLLQDRCRTAGGCPVLIDQLVVLAWMDSGIRKRCVMPANNRRRAILCLGADIELSIFPKRLFDGGSIDIVESKMSLLSSSEAGAMQADYKALSVAVPVSVSSGRPRSRKKETPKEPLFVTLVHGDILLWEGDDFEYTLRRTGMSIVLIGTDANDATRTL